MEEFLINWPPVMRRLILRVAGIHRANRLLVRMRNASTEDGLFITRFLDRQRVSVRLEGELAELGAEPGPLIFVGNHPHGLLDALALASLAEQSGQTFVLLARHFLTVFEPLRPYLLPLVVDAERRSANGSKQFGAALQALAEGRSLVITPAGRLSLPPGRGLPPCDAPWRAGAVRLARASGATLVPVTLTLTVPRWVHVTQRIHPIVRSVLQVWCTLLRRPERIHVRVHRPVPVTALNGLADREATVRLQEMVCGPAVHPGNATPPSSADH